MSDYYSYLNEIAKNFNAGKKNSSLIKLKKLLNNDPYNLEINNLYHQICIKLNLIEDAIKSLKILSKTDLDNITYLKKLYILYIKNNNYEEALIYINKILFINNQNYDALRDKCYILYLQNNINESKKYAKISLDIKNDDYFIYNIIGLINFTEKKYISAIRYFKKAINLKNNYVDGFNNLGNCYYELEDFKNCFDNYKKAYFIDRNDVNSIINITNILSLKNRYRLSIKLLKEALVKYPKNTKLLYNLSLCYFRSKDEINSTKLYNKFIKIQPNNDDFNYAYCAYNLSIGNFTKAWKEFDSRFKIKKNYKSFKNINKIKKKLVDVKLLKRSNKILILREQGIGEEILFSSVYSDIINEFDNINIEADKRLVDIFNNSFNKKVFFREGYFSKSNNLNKFDYIIYAGSFLKLFRKNKESFSKKSYLKSDKKKYLYFKDKLSSLENNIKIGISWKSVLNLYGNLKSLQFSDFQSIFKEQRSIINLQYGNIDSELKEANNKNLKLINFEEIDFFNDFDSIAALLKNLDLFITISNSTAHIAGALGIPTIVICPSKSTTYFYWNPDKENSIWYNNIKVLPVKDSVNKTFNRINEIISSIQNKY